MDDERPTDQDKDVTVNIPRSISRRHLVYLPGNELSRNGGP